MNKEQDEEKQAQEAFDKVLAIILPLNSCVRRLVCEKLEYNGEFCFHCGSTLEGRCFCQADD